MTLPAEGTAHYHFVRIEPPSESSHWTVEGHYQSEIDKYRTPRVTINGWDASLGGALELAADEDDPSTWPLVESFSDHIDIHP